MADDDSGISFSLSGKLAVIASAVVGVLVVVAVALYATGGLDWLMMKFLRSKMQAAGMPATLFKHAHLEVFESKGRPPRALADFGGWWDSAAYTPGWVGRVIVRVDGDKARLNLWRYCPPNHCDEGTFAAFVEPSSDGRVLGLHAKGSKDGMDWVVSLRSDANPTRLLIDERHIRGRDWNTHQQQTHGVTKVK